MLQGKIAQFCMFKSVSVQNIVEFLSNGLIVCFTLHVVFTKSLLDTCASCSVHGKSYLKLRPSKLQLTFFINYNNVFYKYKPHILTIRKVSSFLDTLVGYLICFN